MRSSAPSRRRSASSRPRLARPGGRGSPVRKAPRRHLEEDPAKEILEKYLNQTSALLSSAEDMERVKRVEVALESLEGLHRGISRTESALELVYRRSRSTSSAPAERVPSEDPIEPPSTRPPPPSPLEHGGAVQGAPVVIPVAGERDRESGSPDCRLVLVVPKSQVFMTTTHSPVERGEEAEVGAVPRVIQGVPRGPL
ncbi:unnamed protein product, partial [Cyprideis torosa]